jgi:RND family efflux transporter MFP subunit
VAADETRVFKVNAGTDGFVRDLAPVTTGSLVSRHQWLATLSAPETRTVLQSYLVALDAYDRTVKASETPSGVEIANAGVQQAADRLLALGMSPLQIAEMRRTRVVPPTIRVTAPGAGVVVSRDVSLGQKFGMGDELFVIADLRRVWIHAEAAGPEAEFIRPGMAAEISIPGRARTMKAVVTRESLPEFDPGSQSVRVRLEAENADYLLRPEMHVDVTVEARLPAATVVPSAAVIDRGTRQTVFVAAGDGRFEPRDVETGWRGGGRVAIVRGLAPGERVVAAGAFLLDADRRMREEPAAAGHVH